MSRASILHLTTITCIAVMLGPVATADPSLQGAAASRAIAVAPTVVPLVQPTPRQFAGFGRVAAAVPDADGDGVTDTLVGEFPAVHLYSGATGQLVLSIDVAGLGNEASPESVAGVPDVTGDGLGDLLVGSPREIVDGKYSAGRAYLFDGTDGRLLQMFTARSPQGGGEFGAVNAVTGLSDVDGDGRGDVLIGSPGDGSSPRRDGAAYVFSGSTGARLAVLRAPEPGQALGTSATVAGDVDDDGVDDVLVGSSRGPVYVFSGASRQVLMTLEPPEALDDEADFAHDMALVPDLDGDGIKDFAVGAPGYGEGLVEGSAMTYSGRTGELLQMYEGSYRYSNFGDVVAGADLDGDGTVELLVGQSDRDGAGDGHIYVFDGQSCRRVDPSSSIRGAKLSSALENLGDTDGDRRDDLVIGTAGLPRGRVGGSGSAWLVTSGNAENATSIDQLSGPYLTGLPVSVDAC